jgi:hypothetical protein
MLVMGFLQWWYGPGWRDAVQRLSARIHQTYLTFSAPILLRTLLSPWRRIVSPPGSSIQQKSRAIIDNAVSRAVGFVVRILALIAAGAIITGYGIVGGLLLLTWPLLPLLGPILLVGGFVL